MASPCQAATPQHKTPNKALPKPKVQAHYSLIDGKAIQGQITHQQAKIPVTTSCSPDTTTIPLKLSPKPEPTVSIDKPLPSKAQARPIRHNKIATFFNAFKANKSGIKEHSWVSGINDSQAQQLAIQITEFIATQSNPESTTLVLAKPVKKQWNNPLTPCLENALRQSGFAVTQSKLQNPDAKVLRYEIGVIGDTSVLLRLSFDGKEATRLFFTTDNQSLASSYPFSIRLQGE
jgi:hypothetical protein